MKRMLIVLIAILMATPALAEIQGEDVTYTSGGKTFKGYLVYDDRFEGKRPGVIVVHEWWGHNDYARYRAGKVADLGYVALAIDMYGDGKVASHPDDAGAFAGEVMKNLEEAEARFRAGVDVLKNYPLTDAKHIAAIGYCFGGGTVLHMARIGMDLDAVVSFHGSLAAKKKAEPGMIKAKVLVLTGADDGMVPAESVEAFKEEMDAAGADYNVISYEGAKHSFTNPRADMLAEKFDIGIAYNAMADRQSWAEMQKFFKEVFAD